MTAVLWSGGFDRFVALRPGVVYEAVLKFQLLLIIVFRFVFVPATLCYVLYVFVFATLVELFAPQTSSR